MPLSPVQCVICGKIFQPVTPNARYCGPDCAAKGMNERRKAWELKTGYAAKKREQQRKRRERERATALAERAEQERIAIEERKKRDTEHAERHRIALETALADGDPFARMQLHSVKEAAYWSAYRDYDLQYSAQARRASKTTVNGIPVSDPDFPEAVALSIQESGKIVTR